MYNTLLMHERLTPGQIENARNLSKRFEKSWRTLSHPRRHGWEEADESRDFFEKEGRMIAESVDQSLDTEILDLLNSVFLGVFHHNITIPLEFKSKPPNTN